MGLETRSPEEGAVGKRQRKIQPTRNEGCTPLRPEAEVSGPARREGAVHEGHQMSQPRPLREEQMAWGEQP
jgi:hypothetical protein